jgi:acyl-CoA thioester hydrolase
MSFKVSFATRWADFDPNNHMRHSAYNDYAAESRVRLFNKYGLSLPEFNRLNIGPILFKEETIFLKEITLSDDIVVEVFLKGSSENGERFKLQHKIFRGDGKLAAEINIFAAWMDLKIRKLCEPPEMITNVLGQLEKTDDFEIIILKDKKARG